MYMEESHTTPPPAPMHYNHSRSLAIALVVSAMLLLAAAGICTWLIIKPAGIMSVVQQPTGDGSDRVKSLSFDPPKDMPAAFARRDQNTREVRNTYYYDPVSGCGVTTDIRPMTGQSKQIRQTVVDNAKATHSYGITTTSAADTFDSKLKDADNQHTYTFPAVLLEQAVSIQNVSYTTQRKGIAYKQFNTWLASIEYTCRTDSWDGKKDQLQYLVNGFIVKTEK
jgi:hypothetical protein